MFYNSLHIFFSRHKRANLFEERGIALQDQSQVYSLKVQNQSLFQFHSCGEWCPTFQVRCLGFPEPVSWALLTRSRCPLPLVPSHTYSCCMDCWRTWPIFPSSIRSLLHHDIFITISASSNPHMASKSLEWSPGSQIQIVKLRLIIPPRTMVLGSSLGVSLLSFLQQLMSLSSHLRYHEFFSFYPNMQDL